MLSIEIGTSSTIITSSSRCGPNADYRSAIQDPHHSLWTNAQIALFDSPSVPELRYEERIDLVKQKIPTTSKRVKMMDLIQCTGLHHMKDLLSKSDSGVVLRRPNSYYHDVNSFLVVQVNLYNVKLTSIETPSKIHESHCDRQ